MRSPALLRRLFVAAALLLAPPVLSYFIDSSYYFYLIDLMGIFAIGTLGLGLLVGFAGQISIGHAAFMAIGAFFSGFTTLKLGWPFWLALPAAGLAAGVSGYALSFPALRLSGQYLAIATLGFGVAVPQVLVKWESVSGGFDGLKPPAPLLFGYKLSWEEDYYYLVLIILIFMGRLALNLVRSRTGRAFIALRDSETAAQAMGINIAHYKTLAFAISAFYAGIAGSLYAHLVRFIGATDFNLGMSVNYLTAIVVGGLVSIPGFVAGAAFITALPHGVNALTRGLPSGMKAVAQSLPQVLTGVVLILVVLYLPQGLVQLWTGLKARWAPKGKVKRGEDSRDTARG
jgi:branched-chain amino acid transport system permease protein